MKTAVIIEKGKDGNFSAYSPNLNNHLIVGTGATVEDAKKDFIFAYDEMMQSYVSKNEEIPQELQDLSFEYSYDLSAFFNKYNWINITQFSRIAKFSPSLMRQYKSGQYVSEKQISKIETALHSAAKELLAVKLTV